MIHQGDAKKWSSLLGLCTAQGRTLAPGMVDLIVTSPPYWAQRSYGEDEREIGWGTVKEYVDDLVGVFSGLTNLMKPNAVLVLNIGDKALGSGGAGGDHNRGGMHDGKRKYGKVADGGLYIPKGQWADVPHRLLHALQDDYWMLRADITWDKGKLRRGDYNFKHTRRPGLQHESIFVLTRGRNEFYPEEADELGTVWHFSPNTQARASQAPFPAELPRRAITLFTQPGDLVLDPFIGSGTTCEVATELGRDCIGIDLYA